MKYKIAYIDESPQWINTFYQSFKNDFEILRIQVNSETSIDSLIKKIFNSEIDGVVTDYLLDEEGDVDFNGNKIIESIKDFKPHFPLTMLTAHEPEAINFMDDVHIIYDKKVLDEGNEEELEILKTKIKSNIDRYYSKIETTEKRIEELVKKKNKNTLKPKEEEELTKLFILMDELEPEGKDMPANLIQPEAITKLNDFVSQTREILEELKKKNK
jgi:hypothetical protein